MTTWPAYVGLLESGELERRRDRALEGMQRCVLCPRVCGLAGTRSVLRFLAGEISRNTYVNVMSQYHPCYRAGEVPELGRQLSWNEYEQAVRIAGEVGLTRLDR